MDDKEILYQFLTGNEKDKYGRTHGQILSMSNFKLETTHNYIQWLFPIDTPSGYADSIVLNDEMISSFRTDKEVVDNLRRAFDRMMRFYGFGRNERGQLVITASRIRMRMTWLNRGNHNFLRLTRILRSLHLLGVLDLERELFAILHDLANEYPFLSVPYNKYWEKAVGKE
ncbi:MAG: hypothetical protein IKQ91_01750 [Oscillospiraceae bacterium]|nr:hypothetical protein [Oscillospiraceae bacterium]MBR3448401.1 hypothetical protein [Oscillospiraceae bacterium]MBR4199986.1 hypothetical protein [Oscillospiraceae bacterium]